MSTPRPPSFPDAVVLGGGPAGASAAALLASWGHAVTLVTRRVPPAPELAMSVPPSAGPLVARVGLAERLAEAGFMPNDGNTVWWGAGRERVEPFRSGVGVHVERAAFERTLARYVTDAGVRRVEGTVRRVAPAEGGHSGRWAVDTGTGTTVHARWVLDATGRAGLMAKPDLREADPDTATLALVRRWRAPADTARPGHTLVESYRDGWAWSVPLGGGIRSVTAMVDADVVRGGHARDLDGLHAAELAKTTHLRALIEGAEAAGRAWACPASLYAARAFGGPGFLLVGDCASFIDPLSSYGVKKALASGWLAAVTANTALLDPAAEAGARAFQDRRERMVYASYRRLSAPFFREAALAYGHPYWERRAAAAGAGHAPPASDPAERLVDVDDEGGLPEPEAVEAAWARLKARDRLDAAPGASLRTLRRPGLEGNRIVELDHLASDACPAGLRWVAGVALPDLVRAAPASASVPELYEACAARQPGLGLPAFLTALSTAFAAGFLERAV